MMQLKVLLPTDVLVDEPATKVSAEADTGAFTLLPRHVDYVAMLVPGILTYVNENGDPTFVAVDEGVLVKRGPEVTVSVRNGILGQDLETLWETVQHDFRHLDERERKARSAIVSLEISLARQLAALGELDT